MSEVEQRRDASVNARADAARAAAARRNAWLLAAFAACFYIGYMVWMYLRAGSGG
jgi:hypothetical protein